MSARELITEHLDLWTGVVTKKSSSGRGSNGKVELTGIKKLRELILELAVNGKLVDQLLDDTPAHQRLGFIAEVRKDLITSKRIKSSKPLPTVSPSEAPSELPLGWAWTRLGIISEINPRNTGEDTLEASFIPMPLVTTSYHGEHGDEPSNWGEIKKGYSHFAEGDIGLAKITPCFENSKAAVFKNLRNGIGAGTTELHVARPLSSTVNPYFILLFLKSPRFLTEGKKVMTGSAGQKRVPKNYFAETPLPLPPEEEQHRIVQKVDELMALCDRLEQQTSDQLEAHETLVDTLLGTLTQSTNATELANNWARLAAHFDTLFTTEQSIDKLKQTVLQLAVMGRLVEIDPSDEPASALLEEMEAMKKRLMEEGKLRKLKPLPPIAKHKIPFKLPNGWQWCRLSDVASVVDPNPSHRMPKYVENGIPFISTENFAANDTIDFSIGKRVPESVLQNQIDKFDIREGTFAISRIGTIGKTRVLPTKRNYCMSHALCVISPYADVFDHSYLRFVVSAESSLAQAQHGVQSIGVPDLGVGSIRSLLIPVPPKAKQETIVSKINKLTALCDQLKERLNQASETRYQLAEAVVEGALN